MSVGRKLHPEMASSLESHVATNLEENLTVSDLAAHANMQLPEFYLAFAGTFGCTPAAYIRKKRIEEVQRLLLDPAISVTEIAYSLGFINGNAMGMSFKKQVGCSPTEWRRSHK